MAWRDANKDEIPVFVDVNQRYELPVAVALLKQSRHKTYTDIASGALRVIREGRRVFVPGSEIIRRSTLAA